MSDTKKDQPEKPDQEKGDEVLRRLLRTPPKPKKSEKDKSNGHNPKRN